MSIDKKIVEAKKERVIKTIRREEVDKPPFMFNGDGYYPYYAGIDKAEVTTYEKAAEIMTNVTDDLQYDITYYPFMPANLMTSPMLEILGGGSHVVKNCSKQLSPEDVTIMQPEEYPEFIKDPVFYLLEEALPRRLKLMGDKSFDEKYNGFMQMMGEGQKVTQYLQTVENAGTLVMMTSAILSPVDYINDFLRDFTGIVGDIKRHPELVRDAGLAILENLKTIIKSLPQTPKHKAIFVPMHLPAYLRPKDFEKVYWPSFKGLIDYMIEQGHNVACYFEKNYSHLYDYLQELPKQGIIGVFQEDDLRVVKEKLGKTMTIAGGLSTAIMQHGTENECIEHVKGLIDDLCPGGGYFIASDTPMMFPVDAKRENYKAIADYIKNYRL